MNRTVTFKAAPLTLVGREVSTGMAAPDFHLVNGDLKETTLADFKGKIKVISVFPSLDTPVCDLQVKEFNKRAKGFSPDVVVIGISKDLPFAQKRFCQAHEIVDEVVLSDYKTGSFGINYGFLIKELNLLARGAVIIDKTDVVRYIQVVAEVTSPVNFADVAGNLEAVVKAPSLGMATVRVACKPCVAGIPALSDEAAGKLLGTIRGWQIADGRRIVKEFRLKDFSDAKDLADIISVIAEEQGHHPVLTIAYGKLTVALSTHAAGGLTDNDFVMAGIVDQLGSVK